MEGLLALSHLVDVDRVRVVQTQLEPDGENNSNVPSVSVLLRQQSTTSTSFRSPSSRARHYPAAATGPRTPCHSPTTPCASLPGSTSVVLLLVLTSAY